MSNALKLSVVSALVVSAAALAGPPAQTAKEKRGEYLVRFGGCAHCHTPFKFNKEIGAPMPDLTRFLSGHPEGGPDPMSEHKMPDAAIIGPTFTSFRLGFGVVYSANLTPDKDTGLGSWTEAMFVKAMRTGKHMGGEGRIVLPPMPWDAVAALSDEDLKALFAYLKSIPPIRNAVPSPKVPDEVLAHMTEGANKAAAAHAPPGKAEAKQTAAH